MYRSLCVCRSRASEPRKTVWTDQDGICGNDSGLKLPCLRLGPSSPKGKVTFERACPDIPGGRHTHSKLQGAVSNNAACLLLLPWQLVSSLGVWLTHHIHEDGHLFTCYILMCLCPAAAIYVLWKNYRQKCNSCQKIKNISPKVVFVISSIDDWQRAYDALMEDLQLKALFCITCFEKLMEFLKI